MLKQLINLFIKQTGRKPNAIELLQLKFRAKEKGWAPRVVEGGKPSLKQFTKKENLYEKSEEAARISIGKLKKDLPHMNRNEIDKLTRDVIDRKAFGSFDDVQRKEVFDAIEYQTTNKPDFASGGIARAGFGKGDIVTKGIPSAIKKIKSMFGKDAITTADKIKRPESALTRQLFEDFNKKYSKKPEISFENKINKQLETTYDDISGGSGFTSGDYKYDAQVLADGIAEDLGFAFDDLPINQQTQLYTAALSRMSKNLQMKRALKKASNPTETLKSIEETGGINISNPKVAEEFTRFMKETDPKGYKKLEQKIQIDTFDPKGKKGHASGGIAGQLHLHEGGRVALDKGGPPNPGRRNFMKLAAGLASIPILGKFFKLAKPAAKAAKIAQLKNTTTTMPAWFPDLVNKFMNKGVGKKIDADIMQYKVKELPGVKLEVESSGKVRLEGKNAYKEPYEIDYTPPGYEVLDEVKGKAVKTKGDFVATDTQYQRVGLEGDDFDIDGVSVDTVDELLGGSSTKLEGFAKGTGKTKKTIGQKRIDDSEYYNERADVHDPYESMDPTDFAKGGRASFTKGGLANILRT